jgi:hypothetical protein
MYETKKNEQIPRWHRPEKTVPQSSFNINSTIVVSPFGQSASADRRLLIRC